MNEDSFLKFRNTLRKFVVRYRQEDGSEVTSSTMLGYLRSINWTLNMNDYGLDIFWDPLFVDKKRVRCLSLITGLQINNPGVWLLNIATLFHEKTLSYSWIISCVLLELLLATCIDLFCLLVSYWIFALRLCRSLHSTNLLEEWLVIGRHLFTLKELDLALEDLRISKVV